MKYTYELITTELGEEALKQTDTDGVISWIPMDEANSDYQRYLNPDKVEHLTEIVPANE